MCNITLYIGDNASGKTRVLKNLVTEYKEKGKAVVTNIPGMGLSSYRTDDNKLNTLRGVYNELVKNNLDIKGDKYCERMMNKLLSYTYAHGDILILDEVDVNTSPQEAVDFGMVLSEMKHTWEHIYINGYDLGLLRAFVDIADYIETYNPNVYYVKTVTDIIKLKEDEILEHFDIIRG